MKSKINPPKLIDRELVGGCKRRLWVVGEKEESGYKEQTFSYRLSLEYLSYSMLSIDNIDDNTVLLICKLIREWVLEVLITKIFFLPMSDVG